MNICVVTPYFRANPDWLIEAHRSVVGQTVPARHILVCDGSDPVDIPDFQGTQILLKRNYADYGNTSRLIGCYHAISGGAEAIAFLDADNWYDPDHLRTLATHAQTFRLGAVSSTRRLHRLDGTAMGVCTQIDGERAIDTNCLLVLRPAFPHLLAWVLGPQSAAAVIDQTVWQVMRGNGVRTGFLDRPSVAYRTRHLVHYRIAGEEPPPEAIDRPDPDGADYR